MEEALVWRWTRWSSGQWGDCSSKHFDDNDAEKKARMNVNPTKSAGQRGRRERHADSGHVSRGGVVIERVNRYIQRNLGRISSVLPHSWSSLPKSIDRLPMMMKPNPKERKLFGWFLCICAADHRNTHYIHIHRSKYLQWKHIQHPQVVCKGAICPRGNIPYIQITSIELP